MEFQDDKVPRRTVAIYDYSQHNHGGGWILIQTGVAVQPRTTIERDDFQILMPGGRAVPLPTQKQFLADSARITQLRQKRDDLLPQRAQLFPQEHVHRHLALLRAPW